MKSILCKSTKYTKQKKKRVTFKDDYEKKIFQILDIIYINHSIIFIILFHNFSLPYIDSIPIPILIPTPNQISDSYLNIFIKSSINFEYNLSFRFS